MVAMPLLAQSPVAPWRVVFTASPGHSLVEQQQALLTRYELVVTSEAGGTPTVVNLGKPTPDTQGQISVDINAALIALPVGSYVARVQAVGPGGTDLSPISDPFSLTVRSPGAPGGKPGVSRAGS